MKAGNLLMAHIVMAVVVLAGRACLRSKAYRDDRRAHGNKWRRAKLRERAWGLISRQRELDVFRGLVRWQIAYQRHREAVGVVRALEIGDV